MTHWTTRCLAAAIGACVALPLAGCGSSGTAVTSGSSPAITTKPTPSPTTTTGDPMRDAIITAMTGVSPTLVSLAQNPKTVLRVLPVPPLKGWQVVNLTLDVPPQPRRSYVGVSAGGSVVILSNAPASFATVTQGATVTTPEEAMAVAAALVESTGDAAKLEYPVSSAGDVKWLPKPTGDQQSVIDAFTKGPGAAVTAPTASATVDGWSVTSWWMRNDVLTRHETSVGRDGKVTDTATTVAERLPTVIGR